LHLYQKTLALRRFCTMAQKLGTEAGTFKIRNLNFRACRGCYACNTKLDRCALNDDLTEVLEAVCDTYIPVLASPLYSSDISSRLGAFIGITFWSMVPDFISNAKKPRSAPREKLVLILAQNYPDKNSFIYFQKLDYFFRACGFVSFPLSRSNRTFRGHGKKRGKGSSSTRLNVKLKERRG